MVFVSSVSSVEPQLVAPDSIRAQASPDQRELSVLFDNLMVDASAQDRNADLRIASCDVPLSLACDDHVAGFLVHIRGTATISAGARGWILAAFGATQATRSWPTGSGGPSGEGLNLQDFNLSFFAEEPVLSKEGNPERPEPAPLRLLVAIGVERQAGRHEAMVSVASADICALRA